ncbi:hypothetical protein HDV04_001594 [Boothiomyces sp. JEL0838]|nr:hypothetical protein HDV04_001594 [Boothiomyces sp. JEL0838]
MLISALVAQAYGHNVQNIVHLMLENRAFDTMFGYLTHNPEIDNLVGKNPFCNYIDPYNANSGTVCTAPNQVDSTPISPDHEYKDVTAQIYGSYYYNSPQYPLPPVAPMNGFAYQAAVGAYRGTSLNQIQQIMASYDPYYIPIQSSLAAEFTIFDRWFAAIPGNGCRTIFEDLQDAGLTWMNYYEEEPSLLFLKNLRGPMVTRSRGMEDFYEAAQRGELPNYTFLEPNYGELPGNKGKEDDGHPGGGSMHNTEALIKRIYETLRNSPQWETTLFMITYDEHGGYFDHVPPPRAPNPDGITAYDDKDSSIFYGFDRLGVRVPVTLISPWVPRGAVVHEPYGPQQDSQFTHASIASTIRSIFRLNSPPLSAREAWAGNFESVLLDTPRTDCPNYLPPVNMNRF